MCSEHLEGKLRQGCFIVGEKRGGALCRVRMYRIKLHLRNVNGSGKLLIVDQQQKLITSRKSPVAHAYDVCSTSVNTFLLSCSQTERQTYSDDCMTPQVAES